MKQEDKELLIKDLCARMSYGVKIQCGDYLFTFDKEHMGIGLLYTDFNKNPLESPKIILSGCYYGEDIKPYLRPMSSMIEVEVLEYISLKESIVVSDDITYFFETYKSIDWLNTHHFDYRGLINKDLAIEAPEGMYN